MDMPQRLWRMVSATPDLRVTFVAAEQLTFGWYQVTLLGGRNTVSEIGHVFLCEFKLNERPISKFIYICKS